ncbi:MAG: hypothetical protein RQ733_14140 [Methyloprofundus sp.]|nr:hypothetical protein [Methyloprofundus sp.]MDT8427106.1 hypothetical protein [Methyloprofundus sp.]
MIPSKKIGLRFVVASMLLVSSGCSLFTPAPELSDAEACLKLNAIIADHSGNFQQFKKSRVNSGGGMGEVINMQIWRAEKAFPSANNCQVWEWNTGLTNYICTWQEKGGEVAAKASHDKGVEIVRQCLNDQWTSDTVNTQSGGLRTRFSQPNGKTIIAINAFKESRSLLENWKATLYVGDKSNLEAEVQ